MKGKTSIARAVLVHQLYLCIYQIYSYIYISIRSGLIQEKILLYKEEKFSIHHVNVIYFQKIREQLSLKLTSGFFACLLILFSRSFTLPYSKLCLPFYGSEDHRSLSMTCVRLELDHEWIKSRVWVEKNMDFLSPLGSRRWIMPLVGHC